MQKYMEHSVYPKAMYFFWCWLIYRLGLSGFDICKVTTHKEEQTLDSIRYNVRFYTLWTFADNCLHNRLVRYSLQVSPYVVRCIRANS